MISLNEPWRLSKEWLEQWHLFQNAFYKWVPDKATISAASRETLPDRREIFADAMGVGRGDIGSLDYPDWLSWRDRPTKGHQRHPKTVLAHVIKALRADRLPADCGQDEQLDKSWANAEKNRFWLADEGENQLSEFRFRVRQSMPPLPVDHSKLGQTGSVAAPDSSQPPSRLLKTSDEGGLSQEVDLVSARVRVASFATLLRAGGSIEQILAGISHVFEVLLPMPDTLPGNDMGGGEKWDTLMKEFPFCVFLLLDGEQICGYWMVLPVSDSLYREGLEGKNINKSISILDTEEISTPGHYNLYFVDLFVLPEYRDAQSNIKLLRSFVEFLFDLTRNGVFIKRIFANVSSSAAEKTCMKVGFKYVRDHQEHLSLKIADEARPAPTRIYELDMFAEDRPRLWDHDQALADAYLRELMR